MLVNVTALLLGVIGISSGVVLLVRRQKQAATTVLTVTTLALIALHFLTR